MTIPLLFAFAFLARLINLNQSLWLDEAIVAKVVRSISFFQIPIQFSPHDFHPPLYYLFMSLWGGVFGSSEIALRMPSIFFSLVAGWYVYKIGIVLKNKSLGLWAAAFFLFNPLIIYYSQEARMYMMATAFLTAALYSFLRIIREKQLEVRHVILFNIFSALATFTFYGSVFFILGMILVSPFVIPMKIGIQKGILYRFRIKYGMTVSLCAGFILSLLLLCPLLLQQLSSAKMGLEVVKNWSLILGKAELKNLLMIFLKFATGRLSWYPKWSYYLSAGLATVVTWFFTAIAMRKNKILGFLFFFPLCAGLLVSFVAPMMMYFRFLYLIPVMSILLAIGVTSARMKRYHVEYVVTALFLFFSLLYLLFPQFHREDWKRMVQDMSVIKPVYMILPSSDPVIYYNPSLTVFELRTIKNAILPEHVQVIPYVEEIYGYSHTDILEKRGCVRETQSTYRGPLILEEWKCPKGSLALLSR